MTKLQVGDKVLATLRSGKTFEGTYVDHQRVEPDSWSDVVRINPLFAAYEDRGWLYASDVKLLEPARPKAGDTVAAETRVVTRTVEESETAYPEFPPHTVIVDARGDVFRRGGAGPFWYCAARRSGEFPDHCLAWPVKILRYGLGEQ